MEQSTSGVRGEDASQGQSALHASIVAGYNIYIKNSPYFVKYIVNNCSERYYGAWTGPGSPNPAGDRGRERMDQNDSRDQEVSSLRERLARLGEASLRINESLEFDAVLQDVLDSARDLTRARYGAIILLDEEGRAENVLSSGLTPEEAERLWNVPDAMWFFERLGRIPGPLRVPDLSGFLKSQGLSDPGLPVPAGPFLAAPVRHLGRSVATVYPAREESGPEFGEDDEETLVMFASQAAMVIANARRHREERRTRTDLETLVDTSPVGVVVFDWDCATMGLRASSGRRYSSASL